VNNNRHIEEENWDFIEVSKIDDKIINKLVNNLKLEELSDDFYISFESLLKIGKKAEPIIQSFIDDMDKIHQTRKELFKFILNYIKQNNPDNPLIANLYHPDFIIRAKTIMEIEQSEDLKYIKYILPLLNDPDDSVRWAVIKLLISLDQIKNSSVYSELKTRVSRESNPIIKKELLNILSKT